jgi:hypothetical protein
MKQSSLDVNIETSHEIFQLRVYNAKTFTYHLMDLTEAQEAMVKRIIEENAH